MVEPANVENHFVCHPWGVEGFGVVAEDIVDSEVLEVKVVGAGVEVVVEHA